MEKITTNEAIPQWLKQITRKFLEPGIINFRGCNL
jgi:hypothetical protein